MDSQGGGNVSFCPVFGFVWCLRYLNLASVTSGILFSYVIIIFDEFNFGESKEPRETRVIKFSQKLSILQ